MRPVDCVGSASLDDAACRRFNIILEQTIPCATRVTTERNLLRGDYTESGISLRRPEGGMNIFLPVSTGGKESGIAMKLSLWFSTEHTDG